MVKNKGLKQAIPRKNGINQAQTIDRPKGKPPASKTGRKVKISMDYKEAWLDLKGRLERADYEIWKLIDHRTDNKELIRLKGKHEGINLALDYMNEVNKDNV